MPVSKIAEVVHVEIEVRTGDRLVTDVTDEVRRFVAGRGDGLCHVFVPHATAGIALMETGSVSEVDLATVLERLVPRDDRWTHRHGSPGHGGDHVLPVFCSPSLSIPVLDGVVALGTWQSVVLIDPNRDNPVRRLLLDLIPG